MLLLINRRVIKKQRVQMRADMWILTLEGLIRSKQASGRPKDLRALPELKALQALKESQQEQE